MIDIDLEELLIKKVGGKFRLTSLVQKRMVELNRGMRPLVKPGNMKMRRLVYQEILEDKIQLAPREEVGFTIEEEKTRIQQGEAKAIEEGSGTEPEEIYGSDIKKIKEQRIQELAQLLNNPVKED